MNLKTRGEKIFDALNCTLMLIISFIFLYPFIYEINLSISSSEAASQLSLRLLPPADPTLNAYLDVFRSPAFLKSVWNSVIRSIGGVSSTVLFTICGAYVLAKRQMPLNRFLTVFVLFTMFFSGGQIPGYLLMKSLGLLNNRWAWILPALTSAWNLLVARNFIESIPSSLEESARIDGAGTFNILFRIIFPLSKPIIAVIGLWSFVYHWNAWYDALLYTPSKEQTPLALFLQRILVQSTMEDLDSVTSTVMVTPETTKAAIAVISLLPLILVYPLFQKYIIKGVNVGAVKA